MFREEAEFEEPEKPTGKTAPPPVVMSDCKQDRDIHKAQEEERCGVSHEDD